MYIKWIVCQVNNHQKNAFSLAQEKWRETASCNGFLGQVGGWNLQNNNEACIISFWKDKESLTNFMNNIHDYIFFKNKQSKTYTSISIAYFKSILTMEGSENSISKAIKNGQILRIAVCEVQQNKKTHFLEVQKSIWLPTMKNSEGMLGGEFSINEKNNFQYLVSTFWDTLDNHHFYTQNQLPENKKAAKINEDIKMIKGYLVSLEQNWTVLPQ
ncbi:MAG: YdbC family protein [Lutibacter sp.]